LVLLTVVAICMTFVASTALAVTFNFDDDDDGPNDEPGQKDLTAQASAFDGGDFYAAWKWDDTSWSGGNTGDGCALFDTDADGNVNYSVCATITGDTPALTSVTVYSCGDKKPDRCTNPVLLLTQTSNFDCTITNNATGMFDSFDTQATCNISNLADDPNVPDNLDNGTLRNTCSYPSREPNSDPSDCVKTIANQDVTVSTLSSGTIAWQATLKDTATLNPSSATGSVTFRLYSDSGCTSLVWTSGADNAAPFNTEDGGAGSPANGNVITNLTVDADGVYYWIATYTPTGAFNGDSSSCGEATTINASVSGNPGN
jgi:hypothetical protein